jgi:tetratricopeptide (TPR) repeat protein
MERLQQLMQFLEENPTDSFLQYAIAMEHVKRCEYEEGLKYFENLIKSEPNYIGTYYHLGKLYQKLQRRDDAENCYTRGLVVAKKLNDQHAHSELLNARTNLINCIDEED